MSIDQGSLLEYRIKRLFFHEGYVTHRRVSLKSVFYPDKVDVTDIDVLGIKYDYDFSKIILICECKSGAGIHTVDRLLWLSGLAQFFSSNHVYFTKEEIPTKVKEFAKSIGIVAVDYKRLDELEKQFGINGWVGSHDYQYFFDKINRIYANVKSKGNALSRVYWFTVSGFWNLTADLATKKCISALTICSKEWITASGELKEYLMILFCRLIVLLSVALLDMTKLVYTKATTSDIATSLDIILISGLGTPAEQQELLDASVAMIEDLVSSKLGEKVTIPKNMLGIKPPDYRDDLLDLIDRIVRSPRHSTQVPRFLDFYLHEYILKPNEVDKKLVSSLFPIDTELIAKQAKNVIWFACKTSGIDSSLFKKLIDF